MFWIPMMVGAAGGALMNKKDPLKGALIGAGLGAAGGAGLNAMGGSMGAGGAIGSQQASMLAAQEAGLGTSALGWGGATAGVPGLLNSAGGASGLLNTAGKAANTAAAVKQMMPQERVPIQPPQLAPNVPNPTLSNMYNSMQQEQQQKMAMERQMRQMRRQRGMG